jgi:[ribosomal protein S18]-alanine N-acetyltransferase
MKINIRQMTFDDLDKVYEIETSAHITPWSKGIIHDCIDVGYGCFVLEEKKKKKICGFAIVRISGGECHILNLAVSPKSQGKGFGKKILRYIIDVAKPYCFHIILEVRPTNKVAIKLYERHKFKQTDIKKDYYNDAGGTEDAIVLVLKF